MKDNHYLDIFITEVFPPLLKRAKGHFKVCSLSKQGKRHIINLSLPQDLQDKIITAYEQGKEVRIFA